MLIPALVSRGQAKFYPSSLLASSLAEVLLARQWEEWKLFSFSINQQIFSGQLQSSLCPGQHCRASFADLKRMYTEQQRKPSTKGKDNLQNELEKVFANSVSDKGLIFTIYKEYIQLNMKKQAT